jgi:hypothetical protein
MGGGSVCYGRVGLELEAKGGGGLRVLTTQEQAKSKSKGATMATTRGLEGGKGGRWRESRDLYSGTGTGEGTNGELAWKGHAMNQFL